MNILICNICGILLQYRIWVYIPTSRDFSIGRILITVIARFCELKRKKNSVCVCVCVCVSSWREGLFSNLF